jgi:hypothetical protein
MYTDLTITYLFNKLRVALNLLCLICREVHMLLRSEAIWYLLIVPLAFGVGMFKPRLLRSNWVRS